MSLTEKSTTALSYIREYFPKGEFCAKELSEVCGEKIAAATLSSLAKKSFLNKLGGSPVKYKVVDNIEDIIKEIQKETKGITKEHLEKAKKEKNDEFYTRYEDIESEVMKYRKQFRDKIVYLPCDDPAEKKSEFWSFFVDNFDAFGLKKLIATHYDKNGKAYKIWIDADTIGEDDFIDDSNALQEDLKGDGDFKSEECTEILKECDIVCTNPPFSMFREFVDWIMKENKDCLIIGNNNALSYQEIFRLIKNNRLKVGYTANKTLSFRVGEDYYYDKKLTKEIGDGFFYGSVPAITWFTTLKCSKHDEEMILTKEYNNIDYPFYDNYDAIEVNRVENIPKNYSGVMGVPITFLNKYNPNQFDVIGIMATTKITDINFGYPYVNGKKKYARVLIKVKN